MPKNSQNFWEKLPKPFFALAPMANVTDSVFRGLFAKYGKPDVSWTEFVSADGLMSPARDKLLIDLKFSKKERPIVAQLFSSKPDKMCGAAEFVSKLGFDGIDINMGCPDRAIEKSGSGAAMINDPNLAVEIIKSARKGSALPISIKTRLGYNKIDYDWIHMLLEQNLPALTIHLRTRKEMSAVPAHWEVLQEIIEMRDQISPQTLIIANGDIESVEEGIVKAKKYGCDGIMIGRGIFGKPWFFEKLNLKSKSASRRTNLKPVENSPEERLKIMLEHARKFEREYKGIKNFDVMKKHFKAYVSGWDGAKELRVKLMEAENYKQVKKIVDMYLC